MEDRELKQLREQVVKLRNDNEQLRRLVEEMRMALVRERNMLEESNKRWSSLIDKSYHELP